MPGSISVSGMAFRLKYGRGSGIYGRGSGIRHGGLSIYFQVSRFGFKAEFDLKLELSCPQKSLKLCAASYDFLKAHGTFVELKRGGKSSQKSKPSSVFHP